MPSNDGEPFTCELAARLMAKVSVVIPTRNPGAASETLIRALRQQEGAEVELIVIDSESNDGSGSALRHVGAKVVTVSPREFQHGRTRNTAAAMASHDILVFLTQDAVPMDAFTLSNLTLPIVLGEASATFGRQVPRPGATPLEQYARETNYPKQGRVVSSNGIPSLGIRAYFLSNCCSAIRRDLFEELGGFPTHTIMNEDMLLAAKLLSAGHKIAYIPDAKVIHSHNYNVGQTFQRYFDIGVVFEQAREELLGVDATGEGVRYVRGLFTALWRDRQYAWIPVAVAESAAKWVGQFLGKRHKQLPLPLVRRLSMHRNYWDAPS